MKRLSNTEAKLKESVAYKKITNVFPDWATKKVCFATQKNTKKKKKKNGVNVIIKFILSTKLKVH